MDFHLSTWVNANATVIEFSLRPKGEDRARDQTKRWFYKFYGTKPNFTMGFDGSTGQVGNLLHTMGSEHVGEAWRIFTQIAGVNVGEYISGTVKGLTAAANV